MAKNKIILLSLFCIVGSVGLFSQNTAIDRVRAIYMAELGTREATGRNDGQRVEQYLASCNLPKGNAWCAAFVSWTYQQAGVNAMSSAWSPSWFQRNVIYSTTSTTNQTPQPADVFGIYFASKKRIAHVGFIDQWGTGPHCITVEGNTNEAGSREGDGVYRKRRLKSQIYQVSRWIK
jgi:hypothetical protein